MSAAHHRLQDRSSSCVAACVCMIKSWRGEPADESSLVAQWQEEGRGSAKGFFDLEDAADALGIAGVRWTVNDPALDALRLHVENDGGWVLAWMGSRYYGPWVEQRLQSPYGSLGLRPHSVVLCGVAAEDFLVLDPYFTSSGQPMALPRVQAAEFLTGHLILVPRPP